MRVRVLLVLVAALWGSPRLALAHGLAPSLLELRERQDGRVDVLFRTPGVEGLETPLSPRIPPGCERVGKQSRQEDGLGESERFQLTCVGGGLAGREVAVEGLNARPDAEVFVRISPLHAESVVRVLRATSASLTVPAERTRLATVRDYLRLGVQHILSGYDHLLFVLGLLLLIPSTRALAGAITAFTAAHSLTLSLATLGFVHFPTRAGEAVIALSIVFLARELMRPAGAPPSLSQKRPWVVAFLFGWVHGLGFAGALAQVGLPAGDVPLALLGFNLGVEAGQLGCVAAALALLAMVRRAAPRLFAVGPRPVAFAMGSVATVWFFQRILAIVP